MAHHKGTSSMDERDQTRKSTTLLSKEEAQEEDNEDDTEEVDNLNDSSSDGELESLSIIVMGEVKKKSRRQITIAKRKQ